MTICSADILFLRHFVPRQIVPLTNWSGFFADFFVITRREGVTVLATFVSAVCIFFPPYTLSLKRAPLYRLYMKVFVLAVLDTIRHLYRPLKIVSANMKECVSATIKEFVSANIKEFVSAKKRTCTIPTASWSPKHSLWRWPLFFPGRTLLQWRLWDHTQSHTARSFSK